jgi:hypothetical protein
LRSGSIAKTALASFLVMLLLIAATVSTTHSLHRSFIGGQDNHHLCLLCALAKGQVSAAEVALVLGVIVFTCVPGFRPARTAPLPDSDYRLSPSRAPPMT